MSQDRPVAFGIDSSVPDTSSAEDSTKKEDDDVYVAIFDKRYDRFYYYHKATAKSTWKLPKSVGPSQVINADNKLNGMRMRHQRRKSAPLISSTPLRPRDSSQKLARLGLNSNMFSPPQEEQAQIPMQPVKSTPEFALAPKSAQQNLSTVRSKQSPFRSRESSFGPRTRETSSQDDLPSQFGESPISMLQAGNAFKKFGTHRRPHWKFVRLTEDGQVQWQDLDKADSKSPSKSGLKQLHVLEIVRICKGKTTEVFLNKRNKDIDENLCLSIVTPSRTLDLEAPNTQLRDIWVSALSRLKASLPLTATRAHVQESISMSATSSRDDITISSMTDRNSLT